MEVVQNKTRFWAALYNYSFFLTLNEIKMFLFSIVRFNYASAKFLFCYCS